MLRRVFEPLRDSVESILTSLREALDSMAAAHAAGRVALDAALASVDRMIAADAASQGRLMYAENWIYVPAIQKEREIVEKTDAQILRMTGEESHNGSHSSTYGIWRLAGGGSLIGKGCHPLTGMMYLKRVEGLARNGRPIRPAAVTARTHQVTRLEGLR